MFMHLAEVISKLQAVGCNTTTHRGVFMKSELFSVREQQFKFEKGAI